MKRNVYFIDDKTEKHKFLPDLLIRLHERRPTIDWSDGFDGRGSDPNSWANGKTLARALLDPVAILILDIDLPLQHVSLEGKPRETQKIIDDINNTAEPGRDALVEFFENESVAELFEDLDKKVGTYLLACARAMNKKCVVVTKIGVDQADFLQAMAIPNSAFPDPNLSERWIESRLAKLTDAIVHLIDPYESAAAAYRKLQGHVIHHRLFPGKSDPDMHLAIDYIKNASPQDRSRILDAVRKLLAEGGIPSSTLDFQTAIRTLRTVKEEPGDIALPLVEFVLGIPPLATDMMYKLPDYTQIVCAGNGVRPSDVKGFALAGRTLLALREFHRSPAPGMLACKSTIATTEFRKPVVISFESAFTSAELAKEASRILNLARADRMKGRQTPGQAFDACDWLQTAAIRSCIEPRQETLYAEFEFDVKIRQ